MCGRPAQQWGGSVLNVRVEKVEQQLLPFPAALPSSAGQGWSSLPAAQHGKQNASRSGAVLHAGLCCPWALHGLTTLSLQEPVINACCFPRDALCLHLTVLFNCILSLLSYLFLCHSASALWIKLSGQPVAAGGSCSLHL